MRRHTSIALAIVGPLWWVMPRILIVTGEASGDLHGAHLAKAIAAQDPSAQLVGIGGPGMRAAGVTMIPGVPQLDLVGLVGLSAVRAIIQRVLAVRRVLKAEPCVRARNRLKRKRMKGLEPSTFCMARTMREGTSTAASRQTAW